MVGFSLIIGWWVFSLILSSKTTSGKSQISELVLQGHPKPHVLPQAQGWHPVIGPRSWFERYMTARSRIIQTMWKCGHKLHFLRTHPSTKSLCWRMGCHWIFSEPSARKDCGSTRVWYDIGRQVTSICINGNNKHAPYWAVEKTPCKWDIQKNFKLYTVRDIVLIVHVVHRRLFSSDNFAKYKQLHHTRTLSSPSWMTALEPTSESTAYKSHVECLVNSYNKLLI